MVNHFKINSLIGILSTNLEEIQSLMLFLCMIRAPKQYQDVFFLKKYGFFIEVEQLYLSTVNQVAKV